MKFGIIGAGNHAQKRVMPAIVKAGHEVKAIYSRDVEKAKKIGLKYFSKPYNDMNTFLNGEFDAVYISSPNFLHYEHAMACLKHGKHVLLEKQMTLKISDAEELVRVAREKGLTLSIGFHMRFHPAVRKVREMVRNGDIGKVTYATGMWAGSSTGQVTDPDRRWWDEDEKSGGGSVMGTGVHVLDTINYVLGKDPVRVTSTRLPRKTVIEMTECVNLGYDDTVACAVSSREMKNPDNSLYLYGTEGSIVARNIFGTEVTGTLEHNGKVLESYNAGGLYEEEVKAFVSQVSGKHTDVADGEAGVVVVRIVNAAFDGDVNGNWVEI